MLLIPPRIIASERMLSEMSGTEWLTGRSHGELGRAPWTDPVGRGCDQTQRTQFRWNEVRWDVTRWNSDMNARVGRGEITVERLIRSMSPVLL